MQISQGQKRNHNFNSVQMYFQACLLKSVKKQKKIVIHLQSILYLTAAYDSSFCSVFIFRIMSLDLCLT